MALDGGARIRNTILARVVYDHSLHREKLSPLHSAVLFPLKDTDIE